MTRLRECREKAGYSQKQVALILKLSGPSVSNWENGKTRPTRENVVRLADVYGVTVDYLLGRSDSGPKGRRFKSCHLDHTKSPAGRAECPQTPGFSFFSGLLVHCLISLICLIRFRRWR